MITDQELSQWLSVNTTTFYKYGLRGGGSFGKPDSLKLVWHLFVG